MSIKPQLQNRRTKVSKRHSVSSLKPPAISFLEIANTQFNSQEKLVLDTTDGIKLTCLCGSKPALIRPGRLAYTPATYRLHEDHVRGLKREHKCPYDSPDLAHLIVPALRLWAKNRHNLDVLELGPAHTTEVADGLAFALGSYTAVDFSPPFLTKQRELLSSNPDLLAKARHIVADTYDLSLPDSSYDLIVVSCHPPLVSASVADKEMVLCKISKLLKPGGMLAVFPWDFESQPAPVSHYLLNRFSLRYVASWDVRATRRLLFCQKSEISKPRKEST